LHTWKFEGFTGSKGFVLEYPNQGVNGPVVANPHGDKLRVDAYESTLDAYRKNNTIRRHGILKKWEPVSFRFAGNMEDPYKSQVFWTPVLGANLYNKFMLGMAFYNSILPERKFEYAVMPMYSFHTQDVNGYAKLERHFYTAGIFRRINLGVQGARFAYEGYGNDATYNKIAPFLSFDLNKQDKRSRVDHTVLLRSVNIMNTRNEYSTRSIYRPLAPGSRIDELAYALDNRVVINGSSLKLTLQNITNGTSAIKFFAEAKQTLHYNSPKKKMDLRVFAGTFLSGSNKMPGTGEYEFRASGNTGIFDYTFDNVLGGRSAQTFGTPEGWNGFFSRQIIERDGHLKMPVSIASSNTWLLAANIVSTIPGPVPIRPFLDLAYLNANSYNVATGQIISEATFQYVGGFKVVIAEEILEVNFPLFVSDDFTAFEDLWDKDANFFQRLGNRITFVLNLNKINPLAVVRNVKF
jgi:hypothetical protein